MDAEFFGGRCEKAMKKCRAHSPEKLGEIAYESEKRHAAILYRKGRYTHIALKGAVETVLQYCKNMRHGDKEIPLNVPMIRQAAIALAESGHRVLAVAQGKGVAPKNKEVFSEKDVKTIMEKTGKTEEELNNLLDVLIKRIALVPMEELLPYADEAEKISPDPDDVAYIALALKLKCAIWSQDRKLKENQSKVQVYSTEDLVKMD